MAELMTGDDCISLQTVQSLVAQAQSTDPQDKLAAVQGARKLLSKDKNPPIDEVIQCGFVPILVECLRSKNHQLQFEAVSAITNIASGTVEQTESLRRATGDEAVPLLIELLKSSQPPVCEQAVWALGNIIGAGSHNRNYVFYKGLIDPLLALANPDTPLVLLRTVTWTLSNLLRDRQALLPRVHVPKVLPVLVELVDHEDLAVKMDVCWALACLSQVDYVSIKSGVVPKLVPLLAHKEIKIVLPVLKTLGNLATGRNEQTQALLDVGILPHLLNLMHHPNHLGIVKEALRTVSNIIGFDMHQIQMVIDANLVPAVIDALARGEFEIQKEAVWAVAKIALLNVNAEHISYLVSEGAIPAMCNLLDSKDDTTVQLILSGLNNMLKIAGDQRELIKTAIETSGGLDRLEKLQQQRYLNEDVHKIAFKILSKYFTAEEDD